MRTDNLIEKSTMTSGVADNNSALFADLYANRLVSQIKNSGDRIDLTFTGEGALAFARALVKYVDERNQESCNRRKRIPSCLSRR